MARRKRKAAGEVPPMCNCLLLCDDVLLSQARDKHTLQGVIGLIVVPSLPAVIGGYVAYIRLSNIHGAQKVTISFINARTGESIIETAADFPAHSDPLGVYTVITRVPAFPVTEDGRYLFTVSQSGVPIAQTPIIVQVLDRGREP